MALHQGPAGACRAGRRSGGGSDLLVEDMNIHTQQIDQTVHSIAADIAMLILRTNPIFVCAGGRVRRCVARSFNSAAGVLHRFETTAGAARSSSRAAARYRM